MFLKPSFEIKFSRFYQVDIRKEVIHVVTYYLVFGLTTLLKFAGVTN